MTSRRARWITAGAVLAWLALILFAPLRPCLPCDGRRNPWLDADPEWRKEVAEQVKLCSDCRGTGRMSFWRELRP